MSTWLLFALLAPVLWGITVVIDSIFRNTAIKNDHVLAWFIGISRLPAAIFLFIITSHISIPNFETTAMMLLAGAVWSIPIFLYVRALSFEENTRVALLFTFTPVFTLILANLILHEVLNSNQIVAFSLILLGSVLASLKPHALMPKKWQLSQAFWLIAVACILWALGDVLFKHLETTFTNYSSALFFFLLGNSIPPLIILLFKKGRTLIHQHTKILSKSQWGILIFNLTINISGIFALTYALTLGKASLINVLGGLEALTVFIISAILSQFISSIPKENLSRNSLLLKGASFVLMVVGLIYLQ